jgi:hypothetical protein
MAGALADPGFQHRGVRARAGERPACDRRPDDLHAVPACQFGGLDGAPQRVGVLEDFLGISRGCLVAYCLGVSAVCLSTALVHPDRVQHAEVVCI